MIDTLRDTLRMGGKGGARIAEAITPIAASGSQDCAVPHAV